MASQRLRLRVVSASPETAAVRHLVLAPTEGALPAYTAGSHVRVVLPGGGDRPYSLINLPTVDPANWSLGVLLEDGGAGGSRYMHGLGEGDEVTVSGPVNNFRLHDGPAPALLFAGGIGVTPIASMAAELKARGTPATLHYAGRGPGTMAFVEALRAICGDGLAIHYDSDESRLDIAAALAAADPASHVYTCGPAGMIAAVGEAALARGFPAERIHHELFAAQPSGSDEAGFEVEIASSGQVIEVASGQSIIEAMEAAGLDPLYDCKRGDCGICQVGVLSGVPDHRDVVLSPQEREAGKVMQICVSRARSPRLVLDL